MRKTTVYLNDSQAERLGRMAGATGRSQAELVREGIERVLEEVPARSFRSLGKGRSGGGRERRWDPDELHRRLRTDAGDG